FAVGAGALALDALALDRVAQRVLGDLRLAIGPPYHVLVAALQPGQALILSPDGADHLGGEVSLRVHPAAVGEDPDPIEMELADPIGGHEVDPPGQGGEPPL